MVYLFVLVSSDSYENGLGEHECIEIAPLKFERVIGFDNMYSRLVLVHRVENDLK